MFPKGKFNTDISRNAQYKTLFRSPSDRKRIDMVAERFFAKDRPNFMSAYVKETERSYGYLLIDNQFLDCVRYNEDFVKSRFVITEVLFDTFY